MRLTYLDHGHYRVGDADAGRLARRSPHGRLPTRGYEIQVKLPDGRKAWLARTPYSPRYNTDAPRRGWVWAVRP